MPNVTIEQKRKIINSVVRFKQLFELAGIKANGRRFRCPFHDGQSDSAAIFHDSCGDRLYCFSEEKTYFPTDVVEKGLVDFGIQELFETVWEQISDERKKEILDDSAKTVYSDELPENVRHSKKTLAGFRKGLYDYSVLKKHFVSLAVGRHLDI